MANREGIANSTVTEPKPTPKPLADPPQTVIAELQSATLEVPILSNVNGYCRSRVDCRLSRDQSQKLKSIWQGLEQMDAKLANGRNVANPGNAIQWLLENL